MGLEECDSGCDESICGNPRSRVRVARFYFNALPPQTQDLHGFFICIELRELFVRQVVLVGVITKFTDGP
jgi:hypothetical protein